MNACLGFFFSPLLLRPALTALLVLSVLPSPAAAVQWAQLAQTSRHNVAIDTDSVRLTNLGRLAVWLRFLPRGERHRREAAAEYGQKEYRLHLEYYEIDCGENSAVMGLTDVIGAGGRRLSRTRGSDKPETIPPGSALDLAALKVCPQLEETPQENEDAPPATEQQVRQPSQISEEAGRQITEAVERTLRNPEDFEAWVQLGNAYYDAELSDKAVQAYERALALRPGDTNVLNDQGAMYRQSGDFSRAVANFEKAVAIDPTNLESLYNMGYVYAFDLNQPDKARVAWKRYLNLDSASETAKQVQSFMERFSP